MRRVLTYVGEQCYEWYDSSQAQNTMTAIAKVCAAMFGTGVTVNGLACTPTSPATMTVQIGPGEIYQMVNLEATVAGTLPQDTTHQILKQGIQLNTYTTAAFSAPSTSGQSINYLIEAQYQDSDLSLDPTTGNTPVVLQFYDAVNPSQPWSGPNNSGSTSNTFRDGVVAYQIKAGVAATTGSQVTPTPDANWTGLWVVTVAFGQTSITSSSIAQYTGAPVLPSGLLQSVITSNLTYGIDNGSANTIQASFPIPVTTLTDGMDVWVKVKTANNGATTFTPNPGVISAAPVVGGAHAALQGGELVAGGRANLTWRQDISSWVLAFCTGGAEQVAPATQSQHAVQLGQVAGIVGSVRGGAMFIPTASASATWSAKEFVVESALGGLRYCIANASGTINLATSGAGGMDTGTVPTSGYVAIYGIYNPTTQTFNLLAQNVTSTLAPEIYGGGHMPSGYTASALISVWLISGSQFVVGQQLDRKIWISNSLVLNTSTQSGSYVSLAISAVVPQNARTVWGTYNLGSSAITNVTAGIAGTSSGFGSIGIAGPIPAAGEAIASGFGELALGSTQTLYQFAQAGAGTISWQIGIAGYSI